MIGKVYGIPPQPPVEEQTHRVPAGAVTLGVEYRALDPESLRATYADNPAYLAELEARSPEGGFTDEGVTIHVFDAHDGHEYLRFDVFDDEPHYHYIHSTDASGDVVNNVIDFDTVALGEMLPWVLDFLRGPGRAKVMFATNFPTVGHRHALAQVAELELPAEVEADLLGGTARRVFTRLEQIGGTS